MSETEVSPQRGQELIAAGAQLVDVREPFEHEAGRIAGDRLIEFDRLAAEAGTLDREQPILFYCRSGQRSGVAVEAFRGGGFEAYNLAGGLLAWVEAGLPIEPEDGHVAAH
jgi:rhodanese-related sulfurtransferase